MGPSSEEPPYVVCSDLLYADDTMLLGSNPVRLQCQLDSLVAEGKCYGLELNWTKTVAMRINSTGVILQPSGQPLHFTDSAVYLGGLLTIASGARAELTRRIGEAKGVFRALQRCWAHANISKHRKLQIYQACVVSKLLYGLESVWLLQADIKRLNSFHVQCVRQVLKIPHSYISRISNQEVLDRGKQSSLSSVLLRRQIKYDNKIAQLPQTSPLRQLTCESQSDLPRQWTMRRRRGRPPKQAWASCIFAAKASV